MADYEDGSATEMVEAYGVFILGLSTWFGKLIKLGVIVMTDYRLSSKVYHYRRSRLRQIVPPPPIYPELVQRTLATYHRRRIFESDDQYRGEAGKASVNMKLWDTAGQERFRSVTRSYYRGAAAALLVYDITSRASFLNLSRWLADARALASAQLVTVLVGNKTDREEDREVEWSEASKWAAENDVHFIETSSLTGDNIEKPFALAARAILLSIEGGQLDPEKASPSHPRSIAVLFLTQLSSSSLPLPPLLPYKLLTK
ncbi:hypothetical protein FRC12_023744 [Ceratobasidium sp. 428]|nr:hypothetical protein FRC12_023744 [Ceratobasidium sp. 428]